MKRRTPVLLSACVLYACDENAFESLRSSKSIPTTAMDLRVAAEVHTHLGQQGAADVTHTTLSAELFGQDDGGNFSIELDQADQLNAQVDGVVTPLAASAYPSEQDKWQVYYYADFGNTDPRTEFWVSLNRETEAQVNSVPVTLLEDAGFSVAPADAEVPLTQLLTLQWSETDGYEYNLEFVFACESIDGKSYVSRIIFPNSRVASIASPFTFNPVNFFTAPDPEKVTGCELHSSLYGAEEQTAPADTTFHSVMVRSFRQHHTEKAITLVEAKAE